MSNSSPSNDYPEAIRRAEHQLEMLLKPGGSGGAFEIHDELEICWAALKEDPAVANPELKMIELGHWFGEKMKAAIARQIERSPVEAEFDEGEEE